MNTSPCFFCLGVVCSYIKARELIWSWSVLVDPKDVFQIALLKDACSIIAIHSHPGGKAKPSGGGKTITKKLLDHLIISGEEYFSFLDEGMFQLLKADASFMGFGSQQSCE